MLCLYFHEYLNLSKQTLRKKLILTDSIMFDIVFVSIHILVAPVEMKNMRMDFL